MSYIHLPLHNPQRFMRAEGKVSEVVTLNDLSLLFLFYFVWVKRPRPKLRGEHFRLDLLLPDRGSSRPHG
ncbi:hypothetical protein BDV27DRAFT_120841 [Aspergillus caelatus]|uniref:Uncharacterized protein n=1 Tax=Aspergillus caelatus TaxID=61420 RepID=A0A5N7AK57_9EURO|nr:uncharacterized protein BDV27DRAFT_120841 [Aspergillus caelatus]KAE8369379.1 hypothetical protein BDV27DRAFT_120841 [Aspergillus caelatus]